MKHCFYLILLFVGFLKGYSNEMKVSGIFTDHMVLQRDVPVPVWGWAEPGEKITVTFLDQTVEGVTDAKGRWVVRLAPLNLSEEPRELKIKGKAPTSECVFSDVLVGDVWLLAGQSNMGWALHESQGGKEAAIKANYPWLRYFNSGQNPEDTPRVDFDPQYRSAWSLCSPQSAEKMSAVGFYFAENLHLTQKIPIGLVQTAMGGTYGECWISREAMESDPQLKYYLEQYEEALKKYPVEKERWETEKKEYEKTFEKAALEKKPKPPKSEFLTNGPMGPTHQRRPNGYYNGRVSPVQPYAIRGMIWYQGEGDSEAPRVGRYQKLLTTLASTWRKNWEVGDFPILIVQLPKFVYDDPWHSWPLLREAQFKASLEIPNAGIVCLIDEGGESIHPLNKLPVGERLARLAKGMVYGEKIETTGPIYKSLEIKGDKVVVKFDHIEEGLQSKAPSIQGFTLCGEDKVFWPAQAEIINKECVQLSSEKVPKPTAVRYAWGPAPESSLLNSSLVPAFPFRTDDFEVGHYFDLAEFQKKKAK